MENQNDLLKELENISPELAKVSKKDAFSIPDGYFETLPDVISERIHSGNLKGKVVKGHFFGSRFLKWAAASIIILLLGSGYYYFAWNSFYDNAKVTEIYVLENVDEEIMTEFVADIPSKSKNKHEAIDNSLDNIDEEILMDEL
jgi:hypothetical protein